MFRSTIHTLKNNNYLRKNYNKQLKIIERKNNNNTIYCAFKEKYIIKYTKCNCDNKCSATLSDLQLFNF